MWVSGSTTTTSIGYINRNEQKNLGTRKVAGTDHGQYSYRMLCLNEACKLEYGANGTDIFQRKCPSCQDGKLGIDY